MAVRDTYHSVQSSSEGLFKDLGSRFIAKAYPVGSEAEVKAIVDGIRKEYHDARHHCYAYRLGLDGSVFRANDDGEPSSSAGRPILGQIDSMGLSDVLVVVVRYFGGIKLGIPGLIRAYRTAARDALEHATVIEKVATKSYRLEFDYVSMNAVMKVLKDMSVAQSDLTCDERCGLNVRVRLSMQTDFIERISLIENVKVEEK